MKSCASERPATQHWLKEYLTHALGSGVVKLAVKSGVTSSLIFLASI